MSVAMTDFLTRKYGEPYRPIEIAFGRILFSVPILWVFVLLHGIPAIDTSIAWVYVLSLPLEVTALLLYIGALMVSPLSLTVPFLSFTSLFLLFTSWVMLGEKASLPGMAGVLLIVAGAYSLHLSSSRYGLLTPLKMIAREKGSVMMLGVALIYSITANFGKMGVLKSGPIFFGASYFSLLLVALLFILLKRGRPRMLLRREIVIIGVFQSLVVTFHMLAIQLANVSYMISLKRSSLLFGILLGAMFLGERNLKERLAGGLLMMAGIILIGFTGS